MHYDSAIIERYAGQLYSEANWIIFRATVNWALFFGILALGVLSVVFHFWAAEHIDIPIFFEKLHTSDDAKIFYGALIGAIVFGGIIGHGKGERRAFKLKLEAQVALCQAQIEKNTRGS